MSIPAKNGQCAMTRRPRSAMSSARRTATRRPRPACAIADRPLPIRRMEGVRPRSEGAPNAHNSDAGDEEWHSKDEGSEQQHADRRLRGPHLALVDLVERVAQPTLTAISSSETIAEVRVRELGAGGLSPTVFPAQPQPPKPSCAMRSATMICCAFVAFADRAANSCPP